MPELEIARSTASGRHGVIAALGDLPPSEPRPRWVARRKAQVVAAVEAGLLTLDEARRRYFLSVEEFLGWQQAFHRSGLKGLRVVAAKIRQKKKVLRQRRRSDPALCRSNEGAEKDGAPCS